MSFALQTEYTQL